MGLWSRLVSKLLVKSAGKASQSSAFPFLFSSSSSSAALTGAWTDSRIEQVRHFKHWIYVAVDRIASKIGELHPCVSVVRDIGPNAPVAETALAYRENSFRHKALTQLHEREALEPAPSDHRLVRLMRDPNLYDTAFDLWYETTLYMELTGSAYWWTPCDALGLPEEIWCIPSHWMWPVIGKNKMIVGYEMRPIEGRYMSHFFEADEIIHFKKKNTLSKIDGYSPLTAMAQWIDSSESLDRAFWHSYRNGALPEIILELDPLVQDPTEEQLNRIHSRIALRYGGERNTAKPLICPPGFKAKPFTIAPREMQFGESADRMRDNILAGFGVPKIIAGLVENMTYGAILSGQMGFCSFTINPKLSYLGQMITEKLAWKFDSKLRVWWPDCSPEDPASRERELLTDMKAGAITKNEIRAIRGRTPWPKEIGDVPAGGGDGRGADHGTGNRNPDYPSNEEADSNREDRTND